MFPITLSPFELATVVIIGVFAIASLLSWASAR